MGIQAELRNYLDLVANHISKYHVLIEWPSCKHEDDVLAMMDTLIDGFLPASVQQDLIDILTQCKITLAEFSTSVADCFNGIDSEDDEATKQQLVESGHYVCYDEHQKSIITYVNAEAELIQREYAASDSTKPEAILELVDTLIMYVLYPLNSFLSTQYKNTHHFLTAMSYEFWQPLMKWLRYNPELESQETDTHLLESTSEKLNCDFSQMQTALAKHTQAWRDHVDATLHAAPVSIMPRPHNAIIELVNIANDLTIEKINQFTEDDRTETYRLCTELLITNCLPLFIDRLSPQVMAAFVNSIWLKADRPFKELELLLSSILLIYNSEQCKSFLEQCTLYLSYKHVPLLISLVREFQLLEIRKRILIFNVITKIDPKFYCIKCVDSFAYLVAFMEQAQADCVFKATKLKIYRDAKDIYSVCDFMRHLSTEQQDIAYNEYVKPTFLINSDETLVGDFLGKNVSPSCFAYPFLSPQNKPDVFKFIVKHLTYILENSPIGSYPIWKEMSAEQLDSILPEIISTLSRLKQHCYITVLLCTEKFSSIHKHVINLTHQLGDLNRVLESRLMSDSLMDYANSLLANQRFGLLGDNRHTLPQDKTGPSPTLT